jgi:metallophosphoesterase (TIGR00282 family)
MPLTLAFLGDIVGSAGRTAAVAAARHLREKRGAALVIANGENARNGTGLSPDNLRELRKGAGPGGWGGIDALTLGDHWAKERQILPFLDDPEQPVLRPANLSPAAPGKHIIRLAPPDSPPLYILTVLGRLFMPLPADSPFAAIDRELAAIPEKDAIVLVEIHAEATSEKQAVAWHCLRNWTADSAPRVVAVLGTHTHVPTADARLLDHVLAAQTDVGMCGPMRSVIGRDITATLDAMVRQMPAPLEVASEDVRAQGAIIRIDTRYRRAEAIEPFDLPIA